MSENLTAPQAFETPLVDPLSTQSFHTVNEENVPEARPLEVTCHESLDPLGLTELIPTDVVEARGASAVVEKSETLTEYIWATCKLLLSYTATSAAIFAALMIGVNYSAYSTLLASELNPSDLKTTEANTLAVLSAASAEVVATGAMEEVEEKKENAQERLQRLAADLSETEVSVAIDPFSPKRLVPRNESPIVAVDVTPYDNRIVIPKIGRNVPIVDVDMNRKDITVDNLEQVLHTELDRGVVRYPGTAMPGDHGNAFIFGHSSNYPWYPGNYKTVFSMIHKLEMGDEIVIYYKQKKYVYRVSAKEVVRPWDVKVLGSRDPNKKELTLMTCWPLWSAQKRLLVFAELVK